MAFSSKRRTSTNGGHSFRCMLICFHIGGPVLQFTIGEHDAPSALQQSDPRNRQIGSYPGKPGGSAVGFAQASQFGEGFDKGILHDVFGLGIIAQDRARDPEHAAVVLAHDVGQHIGFAVLRPLDRQSHIDAGHFI